MVSVRRNALGKMPYEMNETLANHGQKRAAYALTLREAAASQTFKAKASVSIPK